MISSRSTRSVGRVMLAVVLALGIGATAASSQTLPELQPGMRVRIRAPSVVDGRVTGKIASRTAESFVVVAEPGAEFTVPFAALSELTVSRGISHAAGAVKGAMWGGGLGLGVGLMFAAVPHSDAQSGSGFGFGPPTAGQSILIGTGSGLAIGFVLGGLSGSERWERVRPPATVAVVPASRGFGIRFALSR